MINNEYYVLERTIDSMLFDWDQRSGKFSRNKPVEQDTPVLVKIGAPVPKAPVLMDHHEMPESVISETIYNVLASLNIFGIQLFPVSTRHPGEDDFVFSKNYWLLHIWNSIACLDKTNSVFSEDAEFDDITSISKLILNGNILSNIDQDQRLVFTLSEFSSIKLVHKSIVQEIQKLEPSGVRFFPVANWSTTAGFY